MLKLGSAAKQPQYPSDGTDACGTPYCGSYDDQGWWGLAWLKAYELTGDKAYLFKAVQAFEWMVRGSWDDSQCGGGNW